MPLCPLLSNRPFSPETKQTISLAFERVCGSLGLNVQDDPATRLVAEKIIALAKRDINDVETSSRHDSSGIWQRHIGGGGSPLATESFENDPKWRIAPGIQLQRNSDETLSFEDELRALGNCEPCHR